MNMIIRQPKKYFSSILPFTEIRSAPNRQFIVPDILILAKSFGFVESFFVRLNVTYIKYE